MFTAYTDLDPLKRHTRISHTPSHCTYLSVVVYTTMQRKHPSVDTRHICLSVPYYTYPSITFVSISSDHVYPLHSYLSITLTFILIYMSIYCIHILPLHLLPFLKPNDSKRINSTLLRNHNITTLYRIPHSTLSSFSPSRPFH